mmetsp:Transcript_10297/g.19493  ORF Transcript_10297/g.19493 Transcript_10297/m.19493 type:complete len:100 (+) Transcript_10297:142-441(+)
MLFDTAAQSHLQIGLEFELQAGANGATTLWDPSVQAKLQWFQQQCFLFAIQARLLKSLVRTAICEYTTRELCHQLVASWRMIFSQLFHVNIIEKCLDVV